MDENDTKAELDDLERESLMPLDELLSSLPKEILEKPASLEPSDRGSGEESEAEVSNQVTHIFNVVPLSALSESHWQGFT